MPNPYTPPGSPVKDPPNARRRSSLGAIALGFGVDILATMVVSTLLSVVAGVSLAAGGSSPEEAAALIDRTAGWLLIGMLGGALLHRARRVRRRALRQPLGVRERLRRRRGVARVRRGGAHRLLAGAAALAAPRRRP